MDGKGEIDVSSMEKVSFASPLGKMNIYADHSGVTKIEFIKEADAVKNDGSQQTEQGQTTPTPTVEESLQLTDNEHLQTCLRWLDQYFKDPTQLHLVENPVLKMNIYSNKSFLVKVWQVLRKGSKPGELLTYMQVAEMAGNSKAGQSVGLAMRRNPFPILVPCHRVVRANAKIGNYCWLDGMKTKKWLLDHEKKFKKAAAAASKPSVSETSGQQAHKTGESKSTTSASSNGGGIESQSPPPASKTPDHPTMSTVDATAIRAQATAGQ